MLRSVLRFGRGARAVAARSSSFALALLALASFAAPARAQTGLVVHGEIGGATMVSPHQRDVLGYDHGFAAMVRPGLRIAPFIGIELSVGGIGFPSSTGFGYIFLAGGGWRLEPMLGDVGRLVLDAHLHYAFTGDLSRASVDAGLGFEFQVGSELGVGPYVRYTAVFAGSGNDGGDANMVTYGVAASFGPSPTATPDTDEDGFLDDVDECVTVPAGASPDATRPGCPLPDTDHDGVLDRDDLCVDVPAGPTPDPDRRGCPLVDTDRDGIFDRDDLCPTEPMGAHPDPARLGCPLADTDGDGVLDVDDVCPTTHMGDHPDPTRRGCPDGDDDGDGFRNASDECPAVNAYSTFHPDPAHPGCPLPDRDHDTVPDESDACPDVAGSPSSNPRRNGCPGLIAVFADHIDIEDPVYFATGEDTILPRSRPVLTALAEALRLTPGILRISIEGHTDDVGTDEANLDLSERRAQSVMRWLIEHDVEASRLEAHGFGESVPVAEGTSRAAREQNRRVMFRVVRAGVANEGGPS
jgi:outer membrane protein OmpA-like peptidoglycan-associated protein